MTGSGAAVFGLFDREEQAAQAAAELRQHYRQVYLCRPDRGGARVVHGRPLVHKKQKTAVYTPGGIEHPFAVHTLGRKGCFL